MKKSYRTLVFTATYNELGNIQSLLNEVWRVIPGADILVVDDNSPDGTGALLDQMAAANKQLKVIHRPRKLGLGTAHHLSMIFAIKHVIFPRFHGHKVKLGCHSLQLKRYRRKISEC